MKTEVVKANQFGLEENRANEITKGLDTILKERELLTDAYKDVMTLEITEENLKTFKELRLRIRDNRTKGITKWKTTNKAYFLAGGNFVQAIYNKEIEVNERMEAKLLEAEKHFERLEAEIVAKIQSERVALLSEYVEDANERDLASMEEDVWSSYLSTKKKAHLDAIHAELEAEKERQAKIKAEKEEQERIRKENAKLKAEAEERERLAKIETDNRAKEEAERKAKEVEEARVQAELNKGDSAKVLDLISDLEALKTKYSFKSAKNKKMYADTCVLIDKVVNHIK